MIIEDFKFGFIIYNDAVQGHMIAMFKKPISSQVLGWLQDTDFDINPIPPELGPMFAGMEMSLAAGLRGGTDEA